MATSLEQLDADLQQTEQQWLNSWLESQGSPPNGTLYHYTDAVGLIGILTQQVFRATNIFYLNDRSEISHCAVLIRDRLDLALHGLSGPIAQVLVQARDGFNPFETLTIYVACFSEVGDQLSQWRGYGGGGRGYSIGVAPRRDHPTQEAPRIITRRVIYDHQKQVELVDDAISALRALAEPLFTKGYPSDSENMIAKLVSFFKRRVGDYLWCFKNSAFSEEQEWRFSFLAGPFGMPYGGMQREIKFRAGAGGVVPYVELDIFNLRRGDDERLAISEVVCGPTLHPKEEQVAVHTLLHANKYLGVQVSQSKVPLRR
jgi:Protein of unknown function (DUF2971)